MNEQCILFIGHGSCCQSPKLPCSCICVACFMILRSKSELRKSYRRVCACVSLGGRSAAGRLLAGLLDAMALQLQAAHGMQHRAVWPVNAVPQSASPTRACCASFFSDLIDEPCEIFSLDRRRINANRSQIVLALDARSLWAIAGCGLHLDALRSPAQGKSLLSGLYRVCR